MTSTKELEKIWSEADCLWDKQQVDRAIEVVASEIEKDMGSINPLVLVIMKGGMVFASNLVLRLRFPLEIDYLHATRYGDATRGSALRWAVPPPESVKGRDVLLVDDIFDEGKTLEEVKSYCENLGASSVRCVVLVNKTHERKSNPAFNPEYCCLNVPDRYVFGYGMDYQGYLRNADGIFAVKGL